MKLGIVFPGQGAQFVGMGKNLFDEYEEARLTFEEANEALGYDLKRICFEGRLSELNQIDNLMPALLTCGVAAFKIYMHELGIAPSFLAGHSLGEYTALVCSGAMSFCDAIKIVHHRGRLFQDFADAGIGTMTIVNGIDRYTVEAECRKVSNEKQGVVVSCYNSAEQIAISGYKEDVMKVEDSLIELGAQINPLIMYPPSHSPLIKPMAKSMEEELKKYTYNDFKWPVISNIYGLPYKGPESIIENLTLQMYHPVRWKETVDYLKKQGVTVILEVGPQSILTNMMRNVERNVRVLAYSQKEDKEDFIKMVSINGKIHIPTIIDKCLKTAAVTQNHNWNNEEYEKGVTKPYIRIQNIRNELEAAQALPTAEQTKESIELLKLIFLTKKVPEKEQAESFSEILKGTDYQNMLAELDGGYNNATVWGDGLE